MADDRYKCSDVDRIHLFVCLLAFVLLPADPNKIHTVSLVRLVFSVHCIVSCVQVNAIRLVRISFQCHYSHIPWILDSIGPILQKCSLQKGFKNYEPLVGIGRYVNRACIAFWRF